MIVWASDSPPPPSGPHTLLNAVAPIPEGREPVALLPGYLSFVCNASESTVTVRNLQSIAPQECALIDTRVRLAAHDEAFTSVRLVTPRNLTRGFPGRRITRRSPFHAACVIYIAPAFCDEIVSFVGLRTDTLSLIDAAPFPMTPDLRADARAVAQQICYASRLRAPTPAILDVLDEAAIDVIVTVLHYLRLRQEALAVFAGRRSSTIDATILSLLRSRNVLEAAFDEPNAIGTAAQRAGMSRYHYQRTFRQVFQCTPGEYRKRRRLEAARRLIEFRGYRVTEAGMEVGYASVSSFINTFRAHFGVSPGALSRERRRKN